MGHQLWTEGVIKFCPKAYSGGHTDLRLHQAVDRRGHICTSPWTGGDTSAPGRGPAGTRLHQSVDRRGHVCTSPWTGGDTSAPVRGPVETRLRICLHQSVERRGHVYTSPCTGEDTSTPVRGPVERRLHQPWTGGDTSAELYPQSDYATDEPAAFP